jgi:inorganic pyrophosphatase
MTADPIPRLPSLMALPSRAGGNRFNVVIDTPRGSRNKYKFDEDLGCFRLSRILPAGMVFPHDFGSIPRTRADDGDALDVLVISPASSFPGCLMEVLLIGIQRGRQRQKLSWVRNDRLLAVPVTAVNSPDFRHINELPKAWMEEMRHFFVNYNRAQGREYRPAGQGGPSAAEQAVRRAEVQYRRTAEAPA